jgi:cytochrome c2
MPAAKSTPQLTEVTVSHSAGGGVHIRSHAAEKSDYSYFEARKFTFQEDWTEDEIEAYVEEKRQQVRERVDIIASAEHAERFDASYMS